MNSLRKMRSTRKVCNRRWPPRRVLQKQQRPLRRRQKVRETPKSLAQMIRRHCRGCSSRVSYGCCKTA
eukprot:symbB.v1.2.007838.t1/scaffold463.1/size291460/19